MENNTNQLNAMMCKRNCGFFGNAACDGYCSKCYKDHVKRQNSGSAAGRVTPTTGLTSAATANATQIATNEVTKSILEDIQPQTQESTATTNRINNVNTSEINDVRRLPETSTTTQPLSTVSPSSTSNSNNQQSSFAAAAVASSSTSSSVPIPIPSRSNSKPSDSTAMDTCGMSVPADLMSSSLLSTSTSPGGAASSIGDNSLAGTSTGSEKKKRTRCVVESCRRKVGLTGFDCRCGGLFCWEHRYSDKHNCQFDYKELGQDQIRKNNPIVVGEKIQKI